VTVADLLEAVRAGGLLEPGRPVVVMYSGGRDSTCLLDLAVRIAGAPAVTALHVNYGLRDAAEADERHCAGRCEDLGVALEIRRPRRPVAPGAGNVQAWARDQRYAAATELAQARGGDVAAGHTSTDQVETILYRLASSPSRRALLGMRARSGTHPPLIRPLLTVTRVHTAEHCRARGLSWRDDESNDSDAYARSRIRHGLVPALEAAHPAAQANVLAVAEILRQEAAVLDELVDETLAGRREISLARLRSLSPALRRLVVQRLADEAASRPAAGVARRADEVAAMADRGSSALDLPAGVRASARDGVVRFGRTPHASAYTANS
jgi:tRNA(Ile)-lysidine synthase